MYNLIRLNQEGIENLNRPILDTETESVIKNLPTNKTSGPDGFTGEFCQTLKKELILLKVFQKIKQEGILSSSFYTVNITLIPKSDKDTTKPEN